MKKICFVTTGDIKTIATAKRALGLANPLSELGWDVSIIMEDAAENRHRVAMECSDSIKVYYFPKGGALSERKAKDKIIKEVNPDYLYICAFVIRNIVGLMHSSKKLVEHSELQSRIPDVKGVKRLIAYTYEYFSIIYSSMILNASKYLQEVYLKRAKRIFRNIPMLYFPYAYNTSVINIVDVDYNDAKFKDLQGSKIFVFLGSVTRNYGIFTVLDAVKSISSKYNGFKVLILGKGRHYNEALQYVKDNKLEDYVALPGFVEEEDIASYFSLASAFISPMNDTIQDWARCPSKMYMYLPYRKPIITCKIGEPYEILQTEGYYYSPGNSLEMMKQMEKVIETDINQTEVNPSDHTWDKRAEEFDFWINTIK